MPDATPPDLAVIIVSYNTRDMTLRCLRDLHARLPAATVETWVVDNASTDGSADAVAAEFPAVRLVRSPANLGFGAANNVALRQTTAPFALLLNSDAFVHDAALQRLLDRLRADPALGAVGPRLLNADGSLQVSAYRFPTPLRAWLENLWISALLPSHPVAGDYRRWAHDEPREVEWLIGAALLLRMSALRQAGLFDEVFFMYSEEADLQRRLRDAGHAIALEPSAVVTHLGGGSGQTERPKVSRAFFDSLDHYVRKHHGALGLMSFRAAMVVGCGVRMVLWLGVWLIGRGPRRTTAAAKARLHSWLVVRQATHRLPPPPAVPA